jgi:hypothetical protein
MKYFVNGAAGTPAIMRLTLSFSLFFLALLWVTNFLMYYQRMGFDPGSVVRYYHGSEQEFAAPRTYGSMLEASHGHLAMMALVLLLLTHLTIFLPWRLGRKAALVAATFGAALLDEGSGWLVRFVDASLAPLKLLGFFGLQLGLGILISSLAWHFARRGQSPSTSLGAKSTRSTETQ